MMFHLLSRLMMVFWLCWMLIISGVMLLASIVPQQTRLEATIAFGSDIIPYEIDLRVGIAAPIGNPSRLQAEGYPPPSWEHRRYDVRSFREGDVIARMLLDQETGEQTLVGYYKPTAIFGGVYWSEDGSRFYVSSGSEDGKQTIIEMFDTNADLLATWRYDLQARNIDKPENSHWLVMQTRPQFYNSVIGYVRDMILVNTHTGDIANLPHSTFINYEWSPDGTWLFGMAVDSNAFDAGHVGFVWFNPDTDIVHVIPHDIAGMFHEWSPTMETISYGVITDSRTYERDVYVMNLASGERQLITHTRNVTQAFWSDEQARLLTWVRSKPATSLYMTHLDTLQSSRVATLPVSADNITLSPDGQTVAYTLRGSSHSRLYLVNIATQQVRVIPNLPKSILWLDWQSVG